MTTTSTNPRVAELLAANAVFAETWATPPTMDQMRSIPRRPVFVLTCMDPRVVPEQFMGPDSRLAVHRNAGGRYNKDVVRSITVLQSLARGKTGPPTVMVVHHTDCGMTHLSDESIRADILNRDPNERDPLSEFGVFTAEDLEKVTLEDVKALQEESLLKDVEVKGYILDTDTALLREL